MPKPAPEAAARAARTLAKGPKVKIQSERAPWAELLQRVFGVDGFACPRCGGAMTLRCVVMGRATEKILTGLQRATGPP